MQTPTSPCITSIVPPPATHCHQNTPTPTPDMSFHRHDQCLDMDLLNPDSFRVLYYCLHRVETQHTVSAASRMCGRGSLGKTSFILNKYHLLSGWIYFSQVLSVFISESVVLAFILETTFVLPRLPLPHIRLAAETVWWGETGFRQQNQC